MSCSDLMPDDPEPSEGFTQGHRIGMVPLEEPFLVAVVTLEGAGHDL